MNRLRHRLPAFAWIATLALLAMALLPTVSHALGHARGERMAWAEVCTPQGMRLVALPAAEDNAPGEPAPLQAAGHLEHCAWCTLGQDTPAWPAAAHAALPVPAAPALAVPQPTPSPAAAPAWPDALPRAPPTPA